jgi:gluconolactonase
VRCYGTNGHLLGKILAPEMASNVCFGGLKKNRLHICGTTSLYAVLTHVNGTQWP